jgi:hypothetical protein
MFAVEDQASVQHVLARARPCMPIRRGGVAHLHTAETVGAARNTHRRRGTEPCDHRIGTRGFTVQQDPQPGGLALGQPIGPAVAAGQRQQIGIAGAVGTPAHAQAPTREVRIGATDDHAQIASVRELFAQLGLAQPAFARLRRQPQAQQHPQRLVPHRLALHLRGRAEFDRDRAGREAWMGSGPACRGRVRRLGRGFGGACHHASSLARAGRRGDGRYSSDACGDNSAGTPAA